MRQLKCKCHNGFIKINGLGALYVDKLASVVCIEYHLIGKSLKMFFAPFRFVNTSNRWNLLTNCYYRKSIVEK